MTKRSQLWWDLYHLGLAKEVSVASKDPSTKVGAIIVRPDRKPVSWGYNGFPEGIEDTDERLNDRETKYKLVVHGEENAIINARESLKDCILYTWPFFTCSRCALRVIQSGIKRVVAPTLPEELRERWQASLEEAQALYEEAGVEWALVDMNPVKGIG